MSISSELLNELKARQDIHDVLTRFCRGADRCDEALMQSCFHDDGWDDHGFFSGPAREFISRAVVNLRDNFLSTKHYLTNEYVEIDGASATSEIYVIGSFRVMRDGELFDITVSARYLDRLERRNDEWKIVHRLLVSDGTRVDPVQEEAPHLNRGRPGARSIEDPSNGYFKAFF